MARKKKSKSNRRLFIKKKKSVFSRPHPIRRKMILRQRKVKAFFVNHDPRPYFGKQVRKVVEQIYAVSDRVKDKIAESPLVVDNPFNKQFYQDRCSIQ